MSKSIFDFGDDDALGVVRSVDTATVVVQVADINRLRKLQVNRLAVLQSSKAGQHLIGVITKITRTASDPDEDAEILEGDEHESPVAETNLVRVVLIGTLADRVGSRSNVFLRTLETVPEIDAYCFALESSVLTRFMRIVANIDDGEERLSIGHYTLDEEAEAFLNGNKLFQRHAAIVGSTGSGKSWTTAKIIESVSALSNGNGIVFDIHGEYTPLEGNGVKHLRIAGPQDIECKKGLSEGVLHLPYWLLGYEALTSMFVDRSDQNAPNQSMVVSRAIIRAKKSYLETGGHEDALANFTIDSPIPFDLDGVFAEIDGLNSEMVEGARGKKQGDLHGKLSRLIQRLESKRTDRRLSFLFQPPAETSEYSWLDDLVRSLTAGTKDQSEEAGGMKVIDFSEVPSDILPLIVSLIARIVFSVQQWTKAVKRHPIALFCDEAHLYVPERSTSSSADTISVEVFERIAKEGRKYGVGLVIISQRPSEVNRTVLSQCNNIVAMRLTNGDDQRVVRKLLPDSLGGFSDLLPILDTGEALVVGDASLLPTRVRVAAPRCKPQSGTLAFWDRWAEDVAVATPEAAVASWRCQSMPT